MLTKKIRKTVSIFIAAAMVFSLSACGGSGGKTELSMASDVEKYLAEVDEGYAYKQAETLAYDKAYLSNDLGFRTAGSDAEHAAADYLASEMKKIGLTDIEKTPVTVDKWQFNDASLKIAGTDLDIMPASYATNGTDEAGITAEIVDVGAGTAADYEGKDVKDKIVLAGIDQWNVAWIDQYMHEAKLHGAAAIITYDTGGYATYSDDMINMQDVCAKDVMPCVSISKKQYEEIAGAIKSGNAQATLAVDNVMLPEQGTSYNVVGKIAGKSSDQQIIVSGHYDIYFNGFQDDSCAIGLVLAMAKAMKDSGYTPENDILFIAHGSEEWGATGTAFDWTTGAWEMINNAHPEWAGKTIAMFNFELPAFYDGLDEAKISCVPEFASTVKSFVESSGLSSPAEGKAYPKGISAESVDTNTMEDGVSYRASGVPYFINIPGAQDGEKGWMQQRYHTVADDRDTYSPEVMNMNLNNFGALAIYIDKTPALELDLTAACDDLDEALNGETAKAAGADAGAYEKAVAELRVGAEALNTQISDINTRYEKAVSDGASAEALAKIRKEGTVLNQKTLEAFKFVQDKFIGIILTSDVVVKHVAYQENINTLSAVIEALKEGVLTDKEKETGALDLAWQINGGTELSYYSFSPDAVAASTENLLEETNQGNLFWGTGKGNQLADTKDATLSLLKKAAALENGAEGTYEEEIAIYEKALKEQQEGLKDTMTAEIKAMKELTVTMLPK